MENWPKKLDTKDGGISQILAEMWEQLTSGGNGILPLLRACYPQWDEVQGPEGFFKAIGFLNEQGDRDMDRMIPLRTLCEAREKLVRFLPGFAEKNGIPQDEIDALLKPIDEAVEKVQGRVQEWMKERTQDGKKGPSDGGKTGGPVTKEKTARPGSDLEVGKTLLSGTLKIEKQEDGSVRMSFGADIVTFFRSPFSDRSILVEGGLMVRSAKGVLGKLAGRVKPGRVVYVDCVAKVSDLKIKETKRPERVRGGKEMVRRIDHDFYVDIVSISPENLASAEIFNLGGAKLPLLDLYKVEDVEGEKIGEKKEFRGFVEVVIGQTEIKGTLSVVSTSGGGLFSAKFVMPNDGKVYYCKCEGWALILPAEVRYSPIDGSSLMFNIPSGKRCSLDATVTIKGDSGDLMVDSNGLRAQCKSVEGGVIDGKPLETLSDGQTLDGDWEIICDNSGSVCSAIFWPDTFNQVSYCAYYSHGGKKVLSPGVFFAEISTAKYFFPPDASFKTGRNYFRGKGKFRHVTDLNRDRRDRDPSYQFVFEPVDIKGGLEAAKHSTTKETLLVPGDRIPGSVIISRRTDQRMSVGFSSDLNKDNTGRKSFVVTYAGGLGGVVQGNSVRDFSVMNSDEIRALFPDGFDIGESRTLRCSAEIFELVDQTTKCRVKVVDVGEKIDDDRGNKRVVDFKEGDIDINSVRLRGKLVAKGSNINDWYFMLDDGTGPYRFNYRDVYLRTMSKVLDANSKFLIKRRGTIDCDVFNDSVNGDGRTIAGAERVFDAEVVLEYHQFEGILANVCRLGKERTAVARGDGVAAREDGVEAGGKKEAVSNVANYDTLAKMLGGEFHDGAYENGELSTGCVLEGDLVAWADNPTFGGKGMVFRLEHPVPGVAYLVSNGFGGMDIVPKELPVVNEHEMEMILSPDCMPDKDKETKVSRCEVMFCGPHSRYPGVCSVFVMKAVRS